MREIFSTYILTMIKTTNTGTLALVHVWKTCDQF